MHNQTSPAQNPPTILEILAQAAEYAHSFKEVVLLELQPHGIMIRINHPVDMGYIICNQQLVSWNSLGLSYGESLKKEIETIVMAVRQRVLSFEGVRWNFEGTPKK